MLLQHDASQVIIVDVQNRLAPVIDDGERVVERCGWIMDLAKDLDIPVLVTEQYPQGLGPTVDTLRARVNDNSVFTKNHFSCLSEPGFSQAINRPGRRQVIVAGMETHVCVLQTVLQLCEARWQVFPVVDALGSRDPEDKAVALDRMRASGATPVTTEMLFFEWIRKAGTPEATDLLRRYLTGPKQN